MFGKKKPEPVKALALSEAQFEQRKQDQLGPKPEDVDPGEPTTWVVILRHGMPHVQVVAHGHDFGQRTSHTEWTTFWTSEPQTWYASLVSVGSVDRCGVYDLPKRWKWLPREHNTTVFSIRATDVVAVQDKTRVEVAGGAGGWRAQP